MKKILILITITLLISPIICHAFQKVPLSNFKIVSFHGDWRRNTLYVIGEIKNIGNIAAGVQIQAIVRDSSGTLIDCESFWPNSISNIQPGASCGINYPISEEPSAQKIELTIIEAQVWD